MLATPGLHLDRDLDLVEVQMGLRPQVFDVRDVGGIVTHAGVDAERPEEISRFQNRFTLADRPDLAPLVTVIGVAPVKPAEFIIFKIGQNAGEAQVEAL